MMSKQGRKPGPTCWGGAAILFVLCAGTRPVRAQVLLAPGAAGKISFATEPITGQSNIASTAAFGTVDGYANQLISPGHGFANLGAPTAVGTATGSITNQALSSSATGPSPFGSGQLSLNGGMNGMGSGILWSSYSVSGAPGTTGLVSLTRGSGSAEFTNNTADTLNISAGVMFGLSGNVSVNEIAGAALATQFTVGNSTFTPYVSIASNGFVEPGFIGAGASGAVQSATFQQNNTTFRGVGSMQYSLLLLSGQKLTMVSTVTAFASGSASLSDDGTIGWYDDVRHDPNGFQDYALVATSPFICPIFVPEFGGTTLATVFAVLLAGLNCKRIVITRRRPKPRMFR